VKNKRSQVYGLSAFIYAIAIAIILIIGLIGLSKEYDLKSAAGFYRFSSVITTKNAEIIQKIMDQERGYAVDKSLFITAAFGGYSPDLDLVCKCVPHCNNEQYVNQHPAECFPNINCGAFINNIPYMGEKIVPRWKNGNTLCIPDINKLTNTFTEFAGSRFSAPSEVLVNSISAITRSAMNLQYVMQLNNVNNSTGIIETSWFSPSQGDIILRSPQPPADPVVEYSFKPFVHISSNTTFFSIYSEAKAFAEQSQFGNIISNPSIIPTIIDEDFKVAEISSTGTIVTFPMPGNLPRPFIALVNYSNTFPNEPNYCTMPAISNISSEYKRDCTVHAAVNSNGQLILLAGEDAYTGKCKDAGNSNKTDDDAIQCVLARVINNINAKLNAGEIQLTPPGSNLSWRYTINKLDLTFYGAPTHPTTANYMSYYVYNTTTPGVFPGSCTVGSCTNATCVNAAYYACGLANRECCTSGVACTGSNLICNASICVACGGRNQLCCASPPFCGTAPLGLQCLSGTCQCGDLGQSCCGSTCNTVDLICNTTSTKCTACGNTDQSCCTSVPACTGNNYCNTSLNKCKVCGTLGQPCCDGGKSGLFCTAALTCNTTSSICEGIPCGSLGQSCCAGLCNTGYACSGTTCVVCGNTDQSCCASSTCTGNNYCDTSLNKCKVYTWYSTPYPIHSWSSAPENTYTDCSQVSGGWAYADFLCKCNPPAKSGAIPAYANPCYIYNAPNTWNTPATPTCGLVRGSVYGGGPAFMTVRCIP